MQESDKDPSKKEPKEVFKQEKPCLPDIINTRNFDIPCKLARGWAQALCDTRVAMNILPYKLYTQLHLVEFKLVPLRIRLGDDLCHQVLGYAKNLEINIHPLNCHTTFVIMTYDAVILGKSFLQ